MRLIQKYLVVVISLSFSISFAQRGKDGNGTINTANTIVNEYTSLTADAASGGTSITVAASGLNVNNRFSGPLAPGDLIMIIQMQGASINGGSVEFPAGSGTFYGIPNDTSWGQITNYNNCGNYEFVQVSSVPNATTISIDCGLKYDYTAAGKVQIVRVPRFSSLTINNPGSITAANWSGTTGGIVAIEVEGNTVINSTGGISVTGQGFRGGALSPNNNAYGGGQMAMPNSAEGAEKGEGIAGYQNDYTVYGGRYCRGAAANAGGGGDCHNAAGGGGANAGSITGWNGMGNPDNSVAGWTTAWNLEGAGFATNTSSGGGKGGYSFAATNQDATVVGPWSGAATPWNGDYRRNNGGLGGRPLNYSTGKIFMGGGGGSGDRDNTAGGAGGRGGGLIYLLNYGTLSGTGSITANGAAGSNSGIDGAGGGGGGGTVILNAVWAISGISVTANGGNGGNQVVAGFITESEGPGGGGGGGYIAVSNGAIGMTANGGANGTTNSNSLTEFPPNGATSGGAGLTNQPISNFTFLTTDTTICSGNTATLTITFSGTVPVGTVVNWYAAQTGGSPIGSGNPFTTPVLTSTTTYYVGTCPGNYRIPVTVTVGSSISPTISGITAICPGGITTLTANGGSPYSWSTGETTTSIIVSPAVTTTYTLTAGSGSCTGTATVEVTVGSGTSLSITGTMNICSGSSTTLTATGGGTYSWNTGETTSSINVSPSTTASYSVTVTNGGCTSSATAQVIVDSLPIPTISGTTTICTGQSTILTATGGNTYTWSTGETTTAITVSPGSTSTYTVTANSGGCSGSATVEVTVGPGLSPLISGTTAICTGQNTTLTVNGGSSYSWSTGETTTSITVSPAVTSTYTVTANSGGCSGTASVEVIVNSGLSPVITGTTTICNGNSTILSTSGGGTYAWNTGATASSITVSPSSTTTYSVTVTNGGCSGTASQLVIVNANPVPTISGATPICTGDSTILTATNGSTYSWSTGETTGAITVSPVVTTTYTVTAGNSGCSGTASIQVVVQSGITPVISGASSICNGGSTILSTTGGGTYSWNDGSTTSSITVSPSITTTYTVTVTNGSCTGTASHQITVGPALTPSISGATTICSGSSTMLSTSGGGTYAWNTGATASSITLSPSSTTTYSVTVTNGSCSGTASVQVTVNTTPLPVISGVSTICSGGTTTLDASGGGTYSWSNGSTASSIIVSPSVTTTYSVTVSNGTCSNTTSQIVTVIPTVTPAISGSNICQGTATTLTASGGSNYLWSTGATTSTISVSPPSTTSYTVTVSSGSCSGTASYLVTVDTLPLITVSPDVTIIYGGSAMLSVSGGGNYSWSPAVGLSCSNCATPTASPLQTTQYCVTVTGSNGCSGDACLTVTVDMKCGEVFVPNAFSPNNDGENDLECVFGNCIQTMTFMIFDRWGEKIFESSDPKLCWDGSYRGKAMNTAVFVYLLKATLVTGETVEKKGNISLIR